MEAINRSLKRNNARVLPNLSGKLINYEKQADFERAIATYQFNKGDEKLENSIRKLWLSMIREELTVPRKFYDSVISALSNKVTPKTLRSIISTVYEKADSDMVANVINDSSFGLMSIEHKLSIIYHHRPINPHVPVILRRNVYMVIAGSNELFVVVVPPNVNLKHCKIITLAKRPCRQDWHFPLAFNSSFIISIAPQIDSNFIRFLVYDIEKDKWNVFPNLPVKDASISFATWIYEGRYVYLFASNGRLYKFDLLDPESLWEVTVVYGDMEGITNKSWMVGLQYTRTSSLVIVDGKRNRIGEIVRGNIIVYIFNHEKNKIKPYIRVYDGGVEYINSVPRLFKRWYFYISRGFIYCSLKQPNLTFDIGPSLKRADALEY